MRYFNSKERCLVCFKPFTKDDPLVNHHITYYPELIGRVHYTCHAKIHDPDNPLTTFIQYDRSDSLRYYQEKETNSKEKRDDNEL
jgi:hypothetical protein